MSFSCMLVESAEDLMWEYGEEPVGVMVMVSISRLSPVLFIAHKVGVDQQPRRVSIHTIHG